MVYWNPYLWYYEAPTHGMLTPLPWNIKPPPVLNCELRNTAMEYFTPHPLYFDSSLTYPWNIKLPLVLSSESSKTAMDCSSPSHDMLNPIPNALWNPYPWYYDYLARTNQPPSCLILWVKQYSNGILTPSNGMLNPLHLALWITIHGMLTPLPIEHQTLRLS
jgi:hypothetical protein